MAGFNLPSVGANADTKALANAFMMLVKELKFLLQNLDSDNVTRLDANKTVFDNLEAETIVTNLLYADTILSNTAVTQVLYAKEGRIARLTVDHLLTGDFLAGSEKIYYIDAQEQYMKFIEGTRNDALPQVQYTDEDENLLYWDSANHNYITPTVTDYPVMVYQYDYLTKLELNFENDAETGFMVPKIIFGAGIGDAEHPERGKGYIYKGANGLMIQYVTSAGKELTAYLNEDGIEIRNGTDSSIIMTDYVDAKMRRIDSVNINKTLGEVTVLMEGETVPETINYTETATSMTFSWADGHTATVSIS